MAVHADIHRAPHAGERAMGVAVQMPRAVMRIPPNAKSVVTQHKKLLSTWRIGILDL
jgi:hypothetical protein